MAKAAVNKKEKFKKTFFALDKLLLKRYNMLYDFGIMQPKLRPQVEFKGENTVTLDIRPLLAGESLIQFDYEINLSFDPEDTSSFFYGVSFPSPMKVKGQITNTAGYMRLSLDLSVDYRTACARCLADVEGEFALSLEKTVATKDMLDGLDEDKLDDYAIAENGLIDVDGIAIEQMEMEFPGRFLCKEDCKGLCQRCGKNLNGGECKCAEGEIDPRMEPLRRLLEQMKEEEKTKK